MQAVYGIFIRGKNGNLLSRVANFISLNILNTVNEVGSWSLNSTDIEKCPFTPGDGIIVIRNNKYFYSGIVTQIQDEMDAKTGLYSWNVRGINDLGYLSHRICYVDPETGSTVTKSHYTDSGILSDVVERLISKNIGSDALLERQNTIIESYDGDKKGDVVNVSLRFQNLLKAIVSLCSANGYNIRSVWDEENLKIYYEIYEARDLSHSVIFTEQLNNIINSEYIGKIPEGNFIIAGGKGEMTAREFSEAENQDSINEWGRIEYFQDARNQDEIEKCAIDTLSKKSDNMIGYSVTASDADNAPQYKDDYDLGDYISAKVADKYILAQVQQVEINVSNGVESVSPKFGTVAVGKFREIFIQLDNLRQDLNELLGTEIE